MRRASGNVTLLHEDNPNLVELFGPFISIPPDYTLPPLLRPTTKNNNQ